MEYTTRKLFYVELKHRRNYEVQVKRRYVSDALVLYSTAPLCHLVTGVANNLQINTKHGWAHIPHDHVLTFAQEIHQSYLMNALKNNEFLS
jgi:hypothetical protein